jgi:hypothetical protein
MYSYLSLSKKTCGIFQREGLLFRVIACRVIAKKSSHLNVCSSCFSSSGSSKLGSLPHMKAALKKKRKKKDVFHAN